MKNKINIEIDIQRKKRNKKYFIIYFKDNIINSRIIRIYFKFKKFKINGYREIAEHIDTMTRTAIPLGIDSESGDPMEEAHEKMNYMVEVLNKISQFSTRDLNFLTRDLEFLEFHYDQTKEPLVNMEIIGPDDSYNDIGGKKQ